MYLTLYGDLFMACTNTEVLGFSEDPNVLIEQFGQMTYVG